MMRFLTIGTALLASAFLVVAASATPAMGMCRKVLLNERSKYMTRTNRACQGVMATSGFIKTRGVGHRIPNSTIRCFAVEAGEPSSYSDTMCANAVNNGGYIKIDERFIRRSIRYPTKISAVNEKGTSAVLAVSGGAVECSTSHYYARSQVSEDSSQIKVVPAYSECTSKFGELKASGSILVNGCEYELEAVEASLSIGCRAGSNVKIETGIIGCIITIGTQGPLPEIGLFNRSEVKPAVVEAELQISEISYTVNSACELGGVKAGKEGKYEAVALFSAFDVKSPFEQVGLEMV
jgi:hypothetical protein